MNIMFKGPLIHYILIREVKMTGRDIISFNLLDTKVSSGRGEFNLITRLRYQTRQVKSNSLVRLRRKYLNGNEDLKRYELDVLFLLIEFENDEDAIKIGLFYFIDFSLIGRE